MAPQVAPAVQRVGTTAHPQYGIMRIVPGARRPKHTPMIEPVVADPSGTMTTGAVSQELGVNRDTTLNWAKDKVIPGVYKTPAGHFRIDVRVVDAIRTLSARGVRLDARELSLPENRAELERALQPGPPA